MWNELSRDFVSAWRSLRQRKAFLFAAVATLAIGIGANTGMFGVVNAVLLAPLPYAESQRLVAFHFTDRHSPGERSPLSLADWQDMAPQLGTLESAAVYTDDKVTLSGGGDPEQIRAVYGSGGLLHTLGVAPLIGRTFVAADDIPGNPGEVVLAHDFWQRRYGGRDDAIGRTIVINGNPRPIVGVMPGGFEFPLREASGLPGPVALWIRHSAAPAARRGPYYLYGVGRVAPDSSHEQAQAQLSVIADSLSREHPAHNANVTIALRPLKDQFVGSSRSTLYALLAATSLVLLIAAVNVSNLLLSRSTQRQRELAVRVSQGASTRHLLRQLLAEGLILATLGALCGTWIGAGVLRFFTQNLATELPRLAATSIDGTVLAFNAIIAAACAIGFGLLPARRATRMDIYEALRPSVLSTSAPAGAGARKMLVGVEVAICFVVLAATGLLLRSLDKLESVERGVVAPERVLTVGLDLGPARYDDAKNTVAFYERLLERSAALPGVLSAGIGTSLPPNQLTITDSFEVEGRKLPVEEPPAPLLFVDRGYFDALGIPLTRGRHFSPGDRAGAPPVVVINEAFAARYLPSQDPIGRRLKIGGPERPENGWMEIVGVVGDVHYNGSQAPLTPAYYVPFRQSNWRGGYLIARTTGDPYALLAPLRRVVAEIDPELPVFAARTMQERFDDAIGAPRFRSTLFAAFGALGLVLGAIGLYAVTATTVVERTREIGVRMALGAEPRALVGEVVRGAMRAVVGGLAAGIFAAVLVTQLLRSLLFEVHPLDLRTFLTTGATLLVVSLAAAWLPARRAAHVDPIRTLRAE
jgi:predicted permease